MTTKIDDDAGETFEHWLYGQIRKENIDNFSSTELAELAWRECARLYTTRSMELQRPLIDPNLRRLASIVAYEGPTNVG